VRDKSALSLAIVFVLPGVLGIVWAMAERFFPDHEILIGICATIFALAIVCLLLGRKSRSNRL
jgi:hypothetical protein